MHDIRKSKTSDIGRIMMAYEESTWAMLEQNIDQWDFNYPSQDHVVSDIAKGNSFLIESEDKVGVIVMDLDQSEEYAEIQWPFDSNKSLVIHRLAVHPQLQGLGIGKKLCLFAEKHAEQLGCDSIRLDAYSMNPISNRLYFRLGYSKAIGECFFHNNPTPFYCYEKRI